VASHGGYPQPPGVKRPGSDAVGRVPVRVVLKTAMRSHSRQLARAYVGCSGWNYQDWRGAFYPAKLPARRWLECYAEHFDTVEVNTTFYRLIQREAVARWVEQVPPSFVFTVKASRYLTHVKRLTDIGEGTARFYERIEPLIEADRLGPVLWQLPATFHRDVVRLSAALRRLPRGRHAFEFRHPSWFTEEVYELLREHGAALVIGDHPERPFQAQVATADWRFIRLHYGSKGRRGNYSRAELESWAQRLSDWRTDGELFVYFNNDWEAFAPANASLLRARLAELSGGSGAGTA
jgi:uncharacterized protein YecE (DUF72 family)